MKRTLLILKAFICITVLTAIPFIPKEASSTDIMEEPTKGFEDLAREIYQRLNIPDLNFETFKTAYKGYLNLEEDGTIQKKILSIIDFSRSSSLERLYIIDLDSLKLKHKTLVAHGKNSGEDYATNFSNQNSSHQSSLGFFLTGETYQGKHGFSMRLDGMENSNCNARSRAIVMHKADYVSRDFITKNGRLGRSHGCPAVPNELNEDIIDLIKDGSCLFIYHPSQEYLSSSKYLLKEPVQKLNLVSGK
jgi:hypothetical protein